MNGRFCVQLRMHYIRMTPPLAPFVVVVVGCPFRFVRLHAADLPVLFPHALIPAAFSSLLVPLDYSGTLFGDRSRNTSVNSFCGISYSIDSILMKYIFFYKNKIKPSFTDGYNNRNIYLLWLNHPPNSLYHLCIILRYFKFRYCFL